MTATYHTTVIWQGEHWGEIVMGNGPQMVFSAPPTPTVTPMFSRQKMLSWPRSTAVSCSCSSQICEIFDQFLSVKHMVQIIVLGAGCENCKKVEAVVKTAVARMGLDAEIDKVTEYEAIQAYGVLATPGLVINEKLVCAARIPAEAEVSSWIADALVAA